MIDYMDKVLFASNSLSSVDDYACFLSVSLVSSHTGASGVRHPNENQFVYA